MTRITSLTKKQEKLMSIIKDERIEVAFDTLPVDKKKDRCFLVLYRFTVGWAFLSQLL